MPSLAEAQQPRPENYVPVERPMPPIGQASTGDLQPVQNPNMRCPVPQTQFSPDASRQFYRGSTVPQFRTFSPAPLTGTSNSMGGSTTTTNVTNNSTTTNKVSLATQNASVSTTVLNPGDSFTGVATLAKSFNLYSITATAAARVRVYATALAQTLDLSRGDNVALNFETTQGVIADVSLDTAPFQWLMSPVPVGANGDFPRTAAIYVTVTNIAASSNPITASLLYLPLES